MTTSLKRHGWWLAAIVVTLLYATPIALQSRVVNCARACFASVESRQQAALPDCEACAVGLAVTMRVPWTHDFSVRVREELTARTAITAYLDAAVGEPSAVALKDRFAALRGAWLLTDGGSGTLKLDLLGKAIPVAEPGRLAQLVGDRRTLIERGLHWNQWYVATAAIEGALLEGKVARAVRLAEHYRGRPNTDLRLRVAAMLCAGMPEGKRAVVKQAYQHAIDVMEARATKRNADFARDFGSARMVVESCAVALGEAPPKQPFAGHAGRLDHHEQLLAYRWRLAHERGDGAARLAARHAIEAFLGRREPTPYRYDLAALFIDEVSSLDDVITLLRLRPGEEPSPASVSERATLRVALLDRPVVPAERYRAARRHITSLIVDADSGGGRPLRSAQRYYAWRLLSADGLPSADKWWAASVVPEKLAVRREASTKKAAPVNRRQRRYELFYRSEHQLASPDSLIAAASLLASSSAELEPWLDALTGPEMRRHSLRSWAFARAGAAKRRGDRAAATVWWKRYRGLVALARNPATAELYLFLGL